MSKIIKWIFILLNIVIFFIIIAIFQTGLYKVTKKIKSLPAKYKLFNKTQINDLLLTQSSVGNATRDGIPIYELKDKIAKKWEGNPVEIVEVENGIFSSLDNRRVVAAKVAEIENLPVKIHQPNEEVPADQMKRFGGAKNYGQAANKRINEGSLEFDKNKVLGFRNEQVRIRMNPIPEMKNFQEKGFIVSDISRKPAVERKRKLLRLLQKLSTEK